MAVPVVASHTENVVSANTTLTLTKPSGVAAGDLLIIIACNDDNGSTSPFTAPNAGQGWTSIMETGSTTTDTWLGVWYRIADGTEGSTHDVVCDAVLDQVGWYLRVTGAHPTTPLDVTGTAYGAGAASSHAIAGVTTTVNDCLAFYALSFDGGDGFPFSVSGTGWSESDEAQDSTSANNSSGTWGTKQQASAGATGTATVTSSVSDGGAGVQWAIAPTTAVAADWLPPRTSPGQFANLRR